jgi:hypothetical protein
MTKTLRDARQRERLTQEDRAHIDRWLKDASDPIWDELADAITAFGQFANTAAESLSLVVDYASLARRSAEKYRKFEPKQDRKKEERIKKDLLALAAKMEDVAATYLACRAAHESRPPSPDSDKHPAILARDESLAWLQKDAQRIREQAAKNPNDPYVTGFFSQIRVSRQTKGQKRSDTRAISIFVQDMAGFMREGTGKPRWATVAALTNVAFRSADIDDDAVRIMCKRRKKPVHSKVTKDKTTR